MRSAFTIPLIALLWLHCSARAQVPYPTAAKTNTTETGLRLDGTTLIYSGSDRRKAGSFLVQNFRSRHWPEETNIGWDRYGDYWILGEFEPAFDSRAMGARKSGPAQFCLFHGFYSIYVTYTPKFGLPPGHPDYMKKDIFQFGFYKTFADTTWYSAYTETARFAPGDLLRYAARHRATDPKGIKIWVRNITRGATWEAESNAYDALPDKPQPIRDIRIGGNSHGNQYDIPARAKDPWFGKIRETVLGQGVLEDQDARDWLFESTVPGAESGSILFQQTRAGRETMIPLHPWTHDPGGAGCLYLRSYDYPYLADSTGVHPYLDHRPCDRDLILAAYCKPGSPAYTGTCGPSDPETVRISYPAAMEISRGDLTRRHIEFGFRVPFWGVWRDTSDQAYSAINFEAASFRVLLEDNDGNTGELRFIPEENRNLGDTRAEAGALTISIPSPGNRYDWRYVTRDLLDGFRRLHPSATRVTVVEVSATGYVQIADIVLLP